MLSPEVLRKLDAIEARFEELTQQLSDPAVVSSGERYKKVAKERASIEATVNALRAYRKLVEDVADNEALLAEKDPELRQMAKDELAQLTPRIAPAEEQLKLYLVPRDPNDEKDVILEIRAGAGGDEAGLFAAELLRLYLRYAERRGWKYELADTSPGALGGIKDAIDIQINPADLETDVFRSTGAGGQSVNTTDSAVRITHKPTGVVVKCQQEKSQLKNRSMAMKMLRAKLYEMETERQRSARDAARKSQVGSGDRSEKIRTYNFPQDRLTDHRINYTRHNLPAVMDGDVQDMIDACRTFFSAEALREASKQEAPRQAEKRA